MKRGTNKIQPHQQIKIPIEFVKKIDRISINQLRQIDLLQKKDVAFNNQYLQTQLQRNYASLSLHQKGREAAIMAVKPKKRENSSRQSSVRFRTTGAGFRQRVLPKTDESNSSNKNIIFRRSPSKSGKTITFSKNKIDKIILKKANIESNNYVNISKQEMRDSKPQRIYFGEKYRFNEKAQYEYNQQINEQDLQWQQQSLSYHNCGFGINNNLSQFDLQSLDDIDGKVFMSKYKLIKGHCPIFIEGKYQWMEVQVIDFDQKTQSVIVHRLVPDDIKKISRLSIKFQTSPQETKIYWRRINQAKRLRKSIIQEEKYIRYVQARKEQFKIQEILERLPHLNFKNTIQNQWLTVYSRQCIIYKEMILKPQKFEEMGIKIRKFTSFNQPPIVGRFKLFFTNQQAIKVKHYSRIDKFAHTLRKLYERLTIQSCRAICTILPTMYLKELLNLQIKTIKQAASKVRINIRQLLISDILGELAFSFKNKTQQIHYIKLHNFIYKDLIIENFYHCNFIYWLQFLSSFSSLSLMTPRPIIKLIISVNQQLKRIDLNPCPQEVVDSLLQPLILLQKSVKSIPDILSEVIGGQSFIKIDKSILQKSKQQIQRIVEYSYIFVCEYCNNLTSKMIYLERSKLIKLPYTKDGLQKYGLMFQVMKQDWYQVTHSIIKQPPLFMADATPLQSTLCDSIDKQKTRLGKLIQKQIEQQMVMKTDQFQQRSQYLKQIPQNYLQVINLRKYLSCDCQDFMDKLIAHYQLTQLFFNLLEEYSYQYSRVTFEKTTQVVFMHHDFMKIIQAKFKELNERQRVMIEEINQQREKIMKELEQMNPQFDIIKNYAQLANYSESYVFTSRNYFSLQKLNKDLEDINYREKLLGQQISIFPLLGKLEREMHPYFDLWNITYQLMGYINTMKTDPICTIKYDELNYKLAQYYKELNRLVNYFVSCKNVLALNICESLIQSVNTAQSKMWIVKSFTLEGINKKQAIRKNILDTIFKGKQVKFQELTLEQLLEENIQEHESFVVKNAQKADRIWMLQQQIAGIVKEVNKLQFEFEYLYNTPLVNEKLLLSLICSVHEQIEAMDQIKDLEQAQYIQKKINSIYAKLVVIQQTLKQINNFQLYFFPILRLTKLEEISRQMSKEISTLVEVERIWKTMCNHFIKQNQLWECIETDSYKNRLQNLFKLMNQVNKKMDQVLNFKRQQFPRLFFINQTDFKAILLNQNELILSRNMSVLFSGIKNIIIEGDKIKGIIGTKEQKIFFKKSFVKTTVWQNLKSIIQEMDKIVTWEINFTLNKNQKHNFSKAIKMLCDWTFSIQEAIGSTSLDLLLDKINNCIYTLGCSCCFENYYICTFLLIQRDKIYNIKLLNVYELSNFQWRKQIRYYKTEEGAVQIKSLNLHLPFQRQFTGHQVRPIVLLSDKSALQIIMCAWTMNNGLLLQGINCETIQQLSGLTLRHFVNINIGSQSNQQEITSYLKGYLLSNCWICFQLTSSLIKGIFNIIAQTAFQVHFIVQSGKTLFYLGAEDYNLSKSFKFNLAISNRRQIEGRLIGQFSISTNFEKSYKFGVVFRSVSWLPPSQSCIIRLKLEALGMTPEFIKTLLECYELYLRKIDVWWYNKDFLLAIDTFCNQYLQIQNKGILDIVQLFAGIWVPQFKLESLQKIDQIFKNYRKKEENQSKILLQMINDIDTNFNKEKRRILVVGSHLSGKMSFILNIFKEANKQIAYNLQYQLGSFEDWQLIDIQFYNNLIPIEQKLILKARQTSHLNPQDVNSFIVYYHTDPVKWKDVVVYELKVTQINDIFKKQVIRQLGVLFNLQKLTQTSNSIKIALTLSFLKLLIILVKRVKIQTLTSAQMTQIVFFLIFWQTIAFFPGLYLKPSTFGSTLLRQAVNYYFDIQKMAWLQWVTMQGMNFNENASQLTELHIPIKETVSVTYFIKLTVNLKIWINSESSGIGTHKNINRIINKGILQMKKVHRNDSATKLSELINFNAGIYKKDGKYYPKLDQILTVCIQDVNLPQNIFFDNYVSILCNHEYEMLLKRKIANINFIFTASPSEEMFTNIDLLIAKSVIRIGALNPSQQSRLTLFTYYLDWFFSNTQNPFSKEVRSTAQILVELSIYLTNKINKTSRAKCTLAHIVKVFEGISNCSPRTIKSSLGILQLWYFEWNSVFHNNKFNKHGISNYDEDIELFMKEIGYKFDGLLQQDMAIVMKEKNIVFIKHSPLNIQYSQTYRKVDLPVIQQYLQNLLNEADLGHYSFLPFIIYPQFLNMVCKIMRVFNIPRRHLLLYGEKATGKQTLLRIGSMVCWGYDASVIANDTNWKPEVINYLKLVKNQKQLCLIFKEVGENNELIQLIQQLMYLGHPQAFLFDQSLKYLSSIGLGSSDSKQYDQFKNNIKKCLHCCVTANQKDLNMLKVKYPAIIRRVEMIDVMEKYMTGQLIQIAKVSVEAFYQKYSDFAQLSSILSQFDIHLSKGQFIRLMQLIVHYHGKSIQQIMLEEKMIDGAVIKIRQTEMQKGQLQIKLINLKTVLHKVGDKVQQLKCSYHALLQENTFKEKQYKDHYEQCQIYRQKTNQIRVQVENQLNKVFPMLNAAEQAMAKVTRDDINQLRSFPNPPLPAAKVVESLIFLFNENQLVKEKVVQGGQKVRDFWEYAKKFILTDRLLKRVSQFKPDVIKNIDSSIIIALKNIIQKPEFLQERVFKASVAAGNLSLWIRAILAVYDVMNLMEPKKKILSQAEQNLQTRQVYLKNELESFNQFSKKLHQNKSKLDLKIQEMQSMLNQIKKLEQLIHQGNQLLELLHIKQQDWNFMKDRQLQQRKVKCRIDAILTVVHLFILAGLQTKKKQAILPKIYQLFDAKHQKYSNIITSLSLDQYSQKIYQTWIQSKGSSSLFPFTEDFLRGIIRFHEGVNLNQQIITIVDKTNLFVSYICDIRVSGESVEVKTIDCLSMKSTDDIFEAFKQKQNEDSQLQEINKSNFIHKNVVLIYNLEHRPQLLVDIDKLIKLMVKYQIVLVVNEETQQWLLTCAQHNISINARIQVSSSMYICLIRQLFQLPIQQVQSLRKSILQKKIRLDLLNIIQKEEKIIQNQSIIKQWRSIYFQQQQMRHQTVHAKAINKLQKQTFQEIVNIINNNVAFQSLVTYIKEYILLQQSQCEGSATIWNLPKFLTTKLESSPASVVKIVQAQNPHVNPLAYLFLQFAKIQQLQQPKITNKFKPASKQTQSNQILNLRCQIVNPASVLNSLNRNENVYLCLVDKYTLRKGLQQCQTIERMKIQACQVDPKQKIIQSDSSNIYLLPEGGILPFKELSLLKDQVVKEAITHKSFEPSRQQFIEAYQMEKFYRKSSLLSSTEKQYFQRKLHHKKNLKIISPRQLYLHIERLKNKQHQNLVIIGINKADHTDSDCIEFCGQPYLLVLNQKGKQLHFWQIEDQLYRLYYQSH